MPTFDLAKLLPWIAGALAIAAALGWFVSHDRAVAREAVAADRADADKKVIEAQEKSIAAQQELINYADNLSKERVAEIQALRRNTEIYKGKLAELEKDPDVKRVLDTRLPESLRELRRTRAADGSGDGVRLSRPAGMDATDAGTGADGSDRTGSRSGNSRPAGRTESLQRGQIENPQPDRKAEAASRFSWLNPLNWFNPSPRTAP